jgi:exosortase K
VRGVSRSEALSTTSALAAGAAFAYGVKSFYAEASADELRFVLAPTAALVELLTGARFELEPGSGYLSRELRYLIAPACAGLNFAIAAFATLVLGFAPRIRGARAKAAWLPAAAALAYLTTLLVNAARIALDLALRGAALPPWFTHAQAHRLEGVAVYLGSLWALYAAVDRCFGWKAARWRVVLVPLSAYLSVALLVPFLNGAHARLEFWTHAREVFAVSLVLTAGHLLTARRERAWPRRP